MGGGKQQGNLHFSFPSDVDQQVVGAMGACRVLLHRNYVLDDAEKESLVRDHI